MHGRRRKLARNLHFGGIRRNPYTRWRWLITRRSQVQILPPLLERPWKQGLSAFSGRIPKRNFCPTFARRDLHALLDSLLRTSAFGGFRRRTVSFRSRRSGKGRSWSGR